MSDFAQLNQTVADLQTNVTAAVANMDKLFADLQAAMQANDQPSIDAATAAIQAEIDKLKNAVAADPAP